MTAPDKQCPQCGLWNTGTALTCDCGYSFNGSDTAPPPETSSPPRRFSWNGAVVIVIVILALGVGLNVWHPLLLAPPLIGSTVLLYAACGLAWLPVLIICALLRPTGNHPIPILLFIIALVLSCAAPAFGPPVPDFSPPMECEVSETQDRIQYVCVAESLFGADLYTVHTYLFEGPKGIPVVWLVSQGHTFESK